MIRIRAVFATTIVVTVLFAAACQKDQLTVHSTAAPPSTHACQRHTVDLNVDSLSHSTPNPPGSAKLTVALCSCDTLVLNPVNIPLDYMFEHWIIKQGTVFEDYDQLVLDTITVNSELWLEFNHGMQNQHVRVGVNVDPCP